MNATTALVGVSTDPAERWLAVEVLTADVLLCVANGDLEGARSRLASGSRTVHAGPVRWSTSEGRVAYSHPEHGESSITLRRLVKLAESARSEAKTERLRAAYRAYVHEAVEQAVVYPPGHGMIGPLDKATTEQLAAAEAHSDRYDKVSRALDAAARAWWDACERRDHTRRALLLEGRRRAFDAALDRLAAASTFAELTSARVRYASGDADDATNGCGVFREPVWAAEHDALFALRRQQLEAEGAAA